MARQAEERRRRLHVSVEESEVDAGDVEGVAVVIGAAEGRGARQVVSWPLLGKRKLLDGGGVCLSSLSLRTDSV